MISSDLMTQLIARTGQPPGALLGRTRTQSLVRARQAIWWTLRELGHSYSEIAHAFHRDHTTIISGVQAFERGGEWTRELRAELLRTEVRSYEEVFAENERLRQRVQWLEKQAALLQKVREICNT